jgi:hypothetical protein
MTIGAKMGIPNIITVNKRRAQGLSPADVPNPCGFIL